MLKNIKLFSTDSDRTTYESSASYETPYVSKVAADNSVHYNANETFTIITIEMTGGDSLVFDSGTKSDGTSLAGFVLRTGETVEIIQEPITVRLQYDDTQGGVWSFTPRAQYTTNSGDTYLHDERYPREKEIITFTPLGDTTVWADID